MRYFLFILSLLIFFSCEPDFKLLTPRPGIPDFSVYIAVGGSETAGFSNNELYRSGQVVSYPNIISRQLLHVGGGEFIQPLMKDELGFGKKIRLSYQENCLNDTVLVPVAAGGVPDESNIRNIYAEGPFHNLGVPWAKIQYLTMPAATTVKPFSQYFNRFSSAPEASLIDDAVVQEATFFSLWTGSADVFDYAYYAGTRNLIEAKDFEEHLNTILARLTAGDAKGIIANIPDVTLYPYFSHINISGVWVEDNNVAQGKRLMNNGERILLSAQNAITCEGLGTEDNPLPPSRILTIDQVEFIRSRTAAFNKIIKDKAAEFDLAFIDINALVEKTEAGMMYDGISFNNSFISGGFFSIDGFSLTRRANAIVANAFIESINTKYGSSIPLVNISQFQGIEYP